MLFLFIENFAKVTLSSKSSQILCAKSTSSCSHNAAAAAFAALTRFLGFLAELGAGGGGQWCLTLKKCSPMVSISFYQREKRRGALKQLLAPAAVSAFPLYILKRYMIVLVASAQAANATYFLRVLIISRRAIQRSGCGGFAY
jgi:hypothetical protein